MAVSSHIPFQCHYTLEMQKTQIILIEFKTTVRRKRAVIISIKELYMSSTLTFCYFLLFLQRPNVGNFAKRNDAFMHSAGVLGYSFSSFLLFDALVLCYAWKGCERIGERENE